MNAPQSPLAIALRRFLASNGARWGLAVLLFFVMIATYAPIIASPVAWLWWDESGLRVPGLVDLFNRNVYGKLHHLLFNVLACLLPLLVLLGFFLRRWRWSRRLLLFGGLVVVTVVLAQLPLIPTEHGWQAPWDRRPLAQETWQAYRAWEESERPLAVFALVPHGFRDKYISYAAPLTRNQQTGARYWLGSDDRGADVLARMAYGARVSLTIGILATGISMLIGVVIGACSGFFGGWTDLILQRLVELMMTFPVLILVLIAVAMLGRDIYVMIVIFGLTGWAGTARLVRGEFLSHMGRDYVLAARALGLPRWRIMFRHVLPNATTPLLISFSFGIAGTVLLESGLAFIGLGDDSVPSWGALLDVGRRQVQYAWLVWVPGLAIFGLVTALNLIGNALREALDPKEVGRA